MSMVEKFLKSKNEMHEKLDAAHEEAMKVFNEKADKICNEFIDQFKAMAADVTNEEFTAFITSGKVDKPDIVAAIAFRAESVGEEPKPEEPGDKRGCAIHVIVLD